MKISDRLRYTPPNEHDLDVPDTPFALSEGAILTIVHINVDYYTLQYDITLHLNVVVTLHESVVKLLFEKVG